MLDEAAAIEYLLSFADFERGGRFHDRPDLAPVLELLRRLGDPHLGRPTVHIAGSKGKGSVAAMTEAVLRAAGHRTGLYTSPHLHSYCERVRIGGRPISSAVFTRLVSQVRQAVEALAQALGNRQLVTFDLLTALAFLAFREFAVEVQVIEVGLGGRVDSTNVFPAKDVAVITPISLEHTAILGDTPEKIAREKAGIITPGCSVVMAPQPDAGAAAAIRAAARAAGATLIDVASQCRWQRTPLGIAGQRVAFEGPGLRLETKLPLIGAHQAENAAVALAAAGALRRRGFSIPEEAMARGLASVRWPGRLEVLATTPLVLADGAHNRDSARRLREALAGDLGAQGVIFIAGSSEDKDVRGLAEEIAPLAAVVIAVRAQHPRAMAPAQVARAFAGLGLEVRVGDTVGGAIETAIAEAGEDGVICLVGSLFVAAEGRTHMGKPSG
jgi:dihydrofolate synthase/folylpolyglutamate synthase